MEINEFRRKYQGKYYTWDSETYLIYAYLKKVVKKRENIEHLRTNDEYEFECIMDTLCTCNNTNLRHHSYYENNVIWFIDETEFHNGSLKRISKKTFKTQMGFHNREHGIKENN